MFKKFLLAAAVTMAATPAFAGTVLSVNCEITDGGNTDVFVLLDSDPTASAVISINGTAQTGSHTTNGPEVSVQASGEIECGTATITVTDGSTTYTAS